MPIVNSFSYIMSGDEGKGGSLKLTLKLNMNELNESDEKHKKRKKKKHRKR